MSTPTTAPAPGIAEHRRLGDVTTLTDSSVMDEIRDRLPAAGAAGDEEA
ncbi:hypothetical protein ACWC09_33600 [Streptomyces sp. NPDC001617]